jgi:molybdopterin-guanine dinucleotide biosynthesis protein A
VTRPSPVPSALAAGILLTGGASRRLGRDKATVVLPTGERCAERGARLLATVTDPCIEVGLGVSGLDPVAEEERHQGPLAALATGHRALAARGARLDVVVLACDMPLLPLALVRLLALWPATGPVVPVVSGRPQWLCARYDGPTAAAWEGAMATGERALRHTVDQTRVTWLGPDQWGDVAGAQDFLDVDTPAALEAVSARLRASGARSAPSAAS